MRGGIVDVWPAQGNEPIRLDFFGDEVERLTSFDIANQRSLHDLDEAVVAPAREWLLSEDARRRAERMIDAMPWGRSTFDRLATGQLFDGMEGWMPLFVDDPRTLLDEVDGATVLVVEPDRVRESTGRPARRGARTDRRRRRDVAGDVRDPAAAPRVGPTCSRGASTSRWTRHSPASSGSINLTSPPIVQGDAARIAAHVRGWSTKRRGVVLTSNAAAVERMADQLRGEGLEVSTDATKVLDVRISVLESSLASGFSVDDPEIVVWSESDLTGRRTVHRAARTRTRNVDGFFDDLAVGFAGRASSTRRGAVLRHDDAGDQRHDARLPDPRVQGRAQLLADRDDRRPDAVLGGRAPGALAHGRRRVAKDPRQGARRGLPGRPGTGRPLSSAHRRRRSRLRSRHRVAARDGGPLSLHA